MKNSSKRNYRDKYFIIFLLLAFFESENQAQHVAFWDGTEAETVGVQPNQVQSSETNQNGSSVKFLDANLRIAFAEIRRGHPQRSIRLFKAVLREAKRRVDRRREIVSLNGLSDAYLRLRRLGVAKKVAKESVRIARQLDDRALLGTCLVHLGNALAATSRPAQALRTFEEALVNAEYGADSQSLMVTALINITHLRLDNAVIHEADSSWRTAMSLAVDLPHSVKKLDYLITLSYLGQQLGRLDERKQESYTESVYRLLNEALRLADDFSDVRGKSYALGHLAELYTAGGRFTDGDRLLKRAIYSANQADAPEILGQWYWHLGKLRLMQGREDEAIFNYERALSEYQSIQNALLYGRRGDPHFFRKNVGRIYRELAELLLDKAGRTEVRTQQQAALRRIRKVMEEFKAVELKNYFRDDCVTAQQEKNRVLELDSLLQIGTATLYPVVFDEKTLLLLSLPSGDITSVSVKVSAPDLRQAAETFRQLMEPARNPRRLLKQAQKLYQWLIAPLKPNLASHNIQTLIVVPDGVLRTIPFAALHDGRDYLVRRYATVVTPGIELTDPAGLSRDAPTILINGLSEGVHGFEALPHVEEEVAGIASLNRGNLLLNKQFVKANLTAELQRSPYNIVSFSTHGHIDNNPEESFVLTYDGKLNLDELERFIRISEFREQPVEMIVLSACNTAVGDERAALGLAGIAVKAGARSAMASLWSVNDESTAKFVPQFFEHLKNSELNKAQALQRAQLELLANEESKHPYYWAPFVLIGNWF